MSRKDREHGNPYFSEPKNPNQKRRARHHDYKRPAKYMLTMNKSPEIPLLSALEGELKAQSGPDIPKAVPLFAGQAVCIALTRWQEQYPQISVDEYVVMPDHIHMCVHVREYLEVGLSRAVSNFMGKCSRAYHDSLDAEQRPAEMTRFFLKGFNDRIAYTDEQYARQINYILDNPRRLMIKRAHPDLFFKKWKIKIGDEQFHAIGNIFLLRNPDIAQVRFSRRYSDDFWEAELQRYKATIENGGVIISPFIHPLEKKVRDEAIADDGLIIRICENGFSERFAPQGVEMQLMGTSRLLLIAPIEHDNRKTEMRYAKAMKLNSIAARFASTNHDIPFALSPAKSE